MSMSTSAAAADAALTQACAWLARLQAETITAEDGVAFDVWLSKSAAHREAYEAALLVWHQVAPPV